MSQSLTFLDNFSFCDEIRPDVARYVRLDPNFRLHRFEHEQLGAVTRTPARVNASRIYRAKVAAIVCASPA
ncbi:hypothetical protein R75465_05380 [Paraburkholderia aspalathi]|nr:hypothetical protein R75465_05380 [Paraburkholderia aspalathi]